MAVKTVMYLDCQNRKIPCFKRLKQGILFIPICVEINQDVLIG